ncbi:thiamine phosphate synthase [Cellulomonas sp. KH9]|uniref:thiamine phosphate synthase n=1 Tax=Cellulomonas sp. KH9 TaxID=1855324 RepID=UPI0008ED24B6|nr:thiamine phosphate synthase [Cellulomonas sp. KH9]SFK37813.1 thiamine-phosphate pyrophosphorylase/hydroxymethylpyrimidine kinase / phosphomethylpyrimidine kinase / thiamine-phosphate diphosphorylase [Cellulomonas sp. KH9]
MSALPEGVYLVLDADVCAAAGHHPADVAAGAVGAGVGTVQVRAKRATVRELVDLTVAVADALRAAGPAVLVVDDRVDVVLAARARGARVDGVHVGRRDLEVADARALLGPGAVVGASAALPDHVRAAAGADYLGSGPVRLTPTKPEAGPAIGVDGTRAAVAAADGRPVVAIGGLGASDAPALRAAGVRAMAVVGAVCAARDPAAAAARLVAAWARAEVEAAAR